MLRQDRERQGGTEQERTEQKRESKDERGLERKGQEDAMQNGRDRTRRVVIVSSRVGQEGTRQME
jgi:hypothetical protein